VSLRIHTPAVVHPKTCAPPSEIAGFVAELPRYESEYFQDRVRFGHAGDGNIHLNFTARTLPIERVEEGIVPLLSAFGLGGTISVANTASGCAKRRFLTWICPRLPAHQTPSRRSGPQQESSIPQAVRRGPPMTPHAQFPTRAGHQDFRTKLKPCGRGRGRD
jgi:hypothetical protein